MGGYPRMDTGCPPVGLSEHSWAFRMWTMLSQAKFWLLSGLLSVFGQSALAAKLWNGWQVRLYCTCYQRQCLSPAPRHSWHC